MALEIERKFLVFPEKLPHLQDGQAMIQGYVSATEVSTVRVRLSDKIAFLTIKNKTVGISRLEFEYPIPVEDAEIMLETLCSGPKIEKTRYKLMHCEHCWEVDIFAGLNAGLIVAEVELRSEDDQPDIPAWIDREVSNDPRYYNSNLMKYPFSSWSDSSNLLND